MAYEIRNQKLPFMFEYWPPGATAPEKRFIIPINPENYKTTRPSKISVTHTKGGVFVDNFGIGIAKILMSGTFGFLGSLPGGPGIHADGAKKDAWNLLKEFEREVFFEFYAQFGSGSNPTLENKAQLRFFNFTDEEFYEVVINNFTVTRSKERRQLYQYIIEMTAIQDLNERPKVSPLDPPTLALKEVPIPDVDAFIKWRKILQGYTDISVKVSDAINQMQSIETTLTTIAIAVRAFRNGATALISAPFSLVETAIRTVEVCLETVVSVVDLPHEITDHMRDMERTLLQSRINRHLYRVDASTNIPTGQNTATHILTAALPSDSVEVEVDAGDTPETSIFVDGIEQAATIAASAVTAMDVDSIEAIAARTMGDASQWRAIAFLNNLEPPFIARTPLSGFSPVLAKGSLVFAINRSVRVDGFTPSPGQVLLFVDGETWESATVESVDSFSGTITIETLMEETFSAGTPVSLHDRALSVVRPGDMVKIPGRVTSETPPTLGEYVDHYDRIFGADEYLDIDGTQADDSSGDAAITVGLRNLEMQLSHRLQTLRGELGPLGHPNYGSLLPALIGKNNTPYWLERIRFEAKATVLEDPRIRSVDSLTMRMEGTAIYIDAMVRAENTDGSRKVSLLL